MILDFKKVNQIFASIAIMIGVQSPASAYDVDTHFYATYAMARYAGIKHSVAAKLATSAQWMDESYLSDPTSMIFLPVTGVKKRRLLHFPGSRISGKLNAKAQQSLVEEYRSEFSSTIEQVILTALQQYSGKNVQVDNLNFKSEVSEAHPFATELLMDGLQEGNLMKAGASLHVLEDSFAHAGTPAEEGHAAFWHWPDRPYVSADKYWRMVDSVFAALVAIRNQLPHQVIDCSYKNLNGTTLGPVANCMATAADLAASYKNIPEIKRAVEKNTLQEAEYVKTAITYMTTLAVDVGYVNLNKESVPSFINNLNIDGRVDGFTTFSQMLKNWMLEPTGRSRKQANGQKCELNICLEKKCQLQLCSMLNDMGQINCEEDSIVDLVNGRINNSSVDVARSCVDEVALEDFSQRTTYELLRWHIPIPLDDTHRIEFEDDTSPVRKKEMEIRISDMQSAIKSMFDVDVEFIPNNSADDLGLWREFYGDPIAEAVIPDGPEGKVYVTFNLKEKQQWDITIFTFLFPSLTKNDLESLIQVGAIFKQSLEEDKEFVRGLQNLISTEKSEEVSVPSLIAKNLMIIAGKKPKYEKIIDLLSPISADFLTDLFLTKVTPSPENTYYANPYVLKKYQSDWPMFMSDQDAWLVQELEFDIFEKN